MEDNIEADYKANFLKKYFQKQITRKIKWGREKELIIYEKFLLRKPYEKFELAKGAAAQDPKARKDIDKFNNLVSSAHLILIARQRNKEVSRCLGFFTRSH